MPLPQTYEEFLASKINPRNYSDILPIIYDLRYRQDRDYVPEAFDRTAPINNAVGQYGAVGVFGPLEQTDFNKGDIVQLTGIATYRMNNGGLMTYKPAIKIVAQIDIGRSAPPTSLPGYQVECPAAQIGSDGAFIFGIPPSVTEVLSAGDHYVYIDAHSPDNPSFRLAAQGDGALNNQRKFIILG